MRILIACGGTGGHIFPAISLARELKNRGHSDIIFTVDDNMRAKEIIKDNGFDFKILKVPKMPYGFSFKWLSFLGKVLVSHFSAKSLIAGLTPDLTIGFGAYLSGPVISAAKSMHKKTLLHEQNATLGRANKMLLNKADKVCFSFDHRLLGENNKYILTGNPIRDSLLKDQKMLTREKALSCLSLSQQKKTLLVLGGSRGARSLNRLIMEFTQGLKEQDKVRLQIIHITGEEDLESVFGTYQRLGITCWIKRFYERMGLLYKATDLIVCRAGATTAAEICLFGIPAILIPYPGAGFHQTENAKVITGTGGAIMLKQEELTADKLEEQILTLIDDEAKLGRMSEAISSLARPQATSRLADAVEELSRC